MLIRLLITYALNLIDLFFTNYWVKKYDLDAEANPFGRWLYGNALTYFFKIGVVGALLFALHMGIRLHPEWGWTSWLVLIVYTIITAIHIVLLIKTKTN